MLGREVANGLNELLGLDRVRCARGDDLNDRGVEALVGESLRHVLDSVERAQLVADRVEVVENVDRLGDVDGNNERSVVPAPKPSVTRS